MADNRPIVYQEGDRWVYRASAVGRSMRCLLLARRGYTPLAAPAYLEKAAEAGTRYEQIVKTRLREDGYRVGGEQWGVEILVGDTAMIRGHLDAGYMTSAADETGDNPFILEIKSMSARMFKKWQAEGFKAFPHYAAQLAIYMEGTGREALYAVVNRDTDEIELRAVPVPPVSVSEIKQKILAVEALATSTTDLVQCDGDTGYYCPYDYLCDRREMLFEEVESGTETVLIRLATEYDEVRRLEAEITARREDIYQQLVSALGDRQSVMAGTWRISYKPSKRTSTKTRELEAFLGQHGAAMTDFQKVTEFKRLNVEGGS